MKRITENRKVGETFYDGKYLISVVQLPKLNDKKDIEQAQDPCTCCFYENNCARGSKSSELPPRHLDCFGSHRPDKTPIKFALKYTRKK